MGKISTRTPQPSSDPEDTRGIIRQIARQLDIFKVEKFKIYGRTYYTKTVLQEEEN